MGSTSTSQQLKSTYFSQKNLVSKSKIFSFLIAIFLIISTLHGLGQVNFTGSYSEGFNSLPATGSANVWTNNSTITGWYAEKLSGTDTTALTINANNGSSNADGIYSFVAVNVTVVRPFITTWKTDNAGFSNSTTILIPTTGTGYLYDVDWNNDGTFEQTGVTGNATHDYGVAGTYTVAIRGDFPRIYFNDGGDKSKILSVEQWGDIYWTSMNSAFKGCNNLVVNASDAPNLVNITDMSSMFYNASSFNQNIGAWDVRYVTNMSNLFYGATAFNQNIGAWTVNAVTNMSSMFRGASAFNQNISSWNVGNVTNMFAMFWGATAFNQNIGSWSVSKVTNMGAMFADALAFNQAIGSWTVSAVRNMNSMFDNATSFNQNIGSWNVGAVNHISYMFRGATAFNQNIGSWNVAAVINMAETFNGATTFNQNLGAWNLSTATNMIDIFKNSGISRTNYDAILIAWNIAGYTNKNLGNASPLTYCAGQVARTIMITNKGWTITGDANTSALPTPTGTANTTICNGASASLSASCTTGTVTWYNTNFIAIPFTGSPYVTPNLTANTTYKVSCGDGSCNGIFVAVSVTINSVPVPTATNSPTICSNTTTSLSATCGTGIAKWFDASGTNLLTSGSPFLTPNLSVDTDYKVRCDDGTCQSAFVNVSVTMLAGFDAGTGVDGAYSATSNTTLAGGTYDFTSFNIDAGVTVTVTGTQPLYIKSTGAVTINGTLLAKGGNGIDGISTIQGGAGGSGIAGGGNGGNGTFYYSAATVDGFDGLGLGGVGNKGKYLSGGGGAGYAAIGASSLLAFGGFGGPIYGDANISGSEAGSGGGGGSGGYDCGAGGGGAGGGFIRISALTAINIGATGTINTNGGNGGTDGSGSCGGGGGGSGGSIWLASPSLTQNGSLNALGGIGGASAVTNNPNYGTGGDGSVGRIRLDYIGSLVVSGTAQPAVGATNTITFTVTTPSGTANASICSNATASLSASCSSGNVAWYNSSSSSLLSTTSPFVTPNLTTTTTYNVRCESGCTSSFVAVSVAINPVTSPTGTANTSICNNATASLSATCTTGTVNWYDSNTNLQATGSPFETLNLTANTTYKVRCEDAGCLSAFVDVLVTVTLPKKIFVNIANTSGTYNGTSWATAFQNLQDALSSACNSDTIWVANGTYKPSTDPTGNPSPTDPRDKTFNLINGVKIFGGFIGTEALLSERIAPPSGAVVATILSGDIGTPNDASDNAYHVVTSVNDDNNTVLDGFTIKNGNANDATNSTFSIESQAISRIWGGGMVNYFSSPILSNIIFEENAAGLSAAGGGAGMANFYASPSISNVVFSANTSNWKGGAIFNSYGSSPIKNAVFSGNTATKGGGIYAEYSSISLNNATFWANTATNLGGAIANYSDGPDYTASIINTVFWGNSASASATAVSADIDNQGGGPIFVSNSSLQLVYNNINYPTSFTDIETSNNIFAKDPLFVASATPTGGDGKWRTTDDGLALLPCSPAIDAGTNDGVLPIDILNNTRPFAANITDMGAYEFQGNPIIAPTGTSNSTICNNTTASLSATCSSGTVYWYPDAAGTGEGRDGSPLVTGVLTNNTSSPIIKSYWVRCESGGSPNCSSPMVQVDVTINPSPTDPTDTASPSICNNTTTSLSATCAVGTINWYDAGGTALLFTGSPFLTPNLTESTTYKVRCESGGIPNCPSAFIDVIVTVNPIVTDPTDTANPSVCSGVTASLSATCTEGTVNWYDTNGTTLLFSGSPFVTPILTANASYKVRCESTCNSNFVAVLVSVNPNPIVQAFGTPNPVCATQAVTLSPICQLFNISATLIGSSQVPPVATAGTGTVVGTLNLTNNVLDLKINFMNLSSNAMAGHIHQGIAGVNGGVLVGFSGVPNATSGEINFNQVVNPMTLIAEIFAGNTYVNIHTENNGSGEIRGQLSATCVANNYVWNPGNLSGETVIVNPSTTTVYTVTANNISTGCSATATTTINVNPKPTAPTITPPSSLSVCSPTTLTLTATCATGTVTWSNAATGTSLTLSAVGTYSMTATCTSLNCVSDASSAVLLEIKAKPVPPTITQPSSLVVCSPNTLTLTASCTTGNVIWSDNSTGTSLTLNAVGTYTISAKCISNGCDSDQSSSTSLEIKAKPVPPIITQPSSLIVCSPTTLTLTATCATGAVTWSNAATGTSLTLSAVGTYSITATCTSLDCVSDASSAVLLEIKALPNAQASNTGPYAFGQTINLSASGGSEYAWSGPNSFSSTIANPSIFNAQIPKAGIYSVTVTNVGCSATATTEVIVSGIDPCVQILAYDYVLAGNPSQTLFSMSNGQNIAQRPAATSIIVRPICNSVTIGSVDMTITGPSLNWTVLQNIEPFALFDNSGPSINGQVLAPGTYSLTVTGYFGDNRTGGTTYGPIITSFTILGNAPTISMPTFAGTEFCAGANVNVSFTTTGTFAGGNLFQVLLSDANGNFNSPQIIGTSNVAGSVLCNIPPLTMGGENYRIKVVSTDPAASGNYNPVALTVNPLIYNLVSPTNDYPFGTATKKAIETINARNNITGASRINYKAGNAINLTPGFQVVSSNGSSFKAQIEGCSN